MREFGIWRDRHVDLRLMGRRCRCGFPNGVRYVIEILAWTMFLLLLGRVDVFLDPGAATDHELRSLSVILLRFVAVYCMADGLNIMFMSVLAGAGDTRWMLIVSGGLHVGFLAVLLGLSLVHATLYTFWV